MTNIICKQKKCIYYKEIKSKIKGRCSASAIGINESLECDSYFEKRDVEEIIKNVSN